MFMHMCICTHLTTSHYVYNYVLMDIHKCIIIQTLLFIQILMSVVMVQIFVLKHVLTLMDASLVDVIVVIYWMMMGLLVMVSTNMCTIMIINLHIHIHTNINAYLHAYLFAKHINKYIWRLMGLHAVVCAHVPMSINACNYK